MLLSRDKVEIEIFVPGHKSRVSIWTRHMNQRGRIQDVLYFVSTVLHICFLTMTLITCLRDNINETKVDMHVLGVKNDIIVTYLMKTTVMTFLIQTTLLTWWYSDDISDLPYKDDIKLKTKLITHRIKTTLLRRH